MFFKIHRGTQEIGGICVEIWTDKTRILLDFGIPLVEKDGTIGDGVSRGARDFESFDDFIDYLEKNGIQKVSLMYHAIINDDNNWAKDGAGIKIEHLTLDHFMWLSTKSEGETRYLEIDYKSIKPYILETNSS
jgi:hypothetical protein